MCHSAISCGPLSAKVEGDVAAARGRGGSTIGAERKSFANDIDRPMREGGRRLPTMSVKLISLVTVAVALSSPGCSAFLSVASRHVSKPQYGLRVQTLLGAAPTKGLSPVPKGISPFEKSLSKSIDIQGTLRKTAKRAIEAAIADGVSKIEVEFPPLLGGAQSKSQFDDFDNVQELDRNKEWTMQLAPMFAGDKTYKDGRTWLVFPDLKECELAKKDYPGQRYQEATFTTIEAVTNFMSSSGDTESSEGYAAPWGASLMSGLSSMMGGKDGDAGLLGDQSSLDSLNVDSPANLWLVVQPGNGGPVEDWVNCEKMHSPSIPMVVINGALDKVKGGFYAPVFFPALAATVERFWKKFETGLYLKPFSDKGVYGWLYRVYPEPWQVIYEKVTPDKNGNAQVEYQTVEVMDTKPSYNQVVSILLKASQIQ